MLFPNIWLWFLLLSAHAYLETCNNSCLTDWESPTLMSCSLSMYDTPSKSRYLKHQFLSVPYFMKRRWVSYRNSCCPRGEWLNRTWARRTSKVGLQQVKMAWLHRPPPIIMGHCIRDRELNKFSKNRQEVGRTWAKLLALTMKIIKTFHHTDELPAGSLLELSQHSHCLKHLHNLSRFEGAL